jgi:ribosome maturation factor RimP
LVGRRNFKGVLKQVSDTGIELLVDDMVYAFTFEEIDKARVMPDIRIGSGHERQKDEH